MQVYKVNKKNQILQGLVDKMEIFSVQACWSP